MLSAYQRAGCGVSALKLLREMDLDGVRPDSVTYVSYVTACSSAGAVEQGKFTHSRIAATGHFAADVSVGNSLVNMYGKFGLVEEARTVFESMVARNTVTWNTLIGAYTQNGHSREALVLYKLAKESGVKMSYVTYVVALGACSTLGQGREGREIQQRIKAEGLQTNACVANALITMYGRCGSLVDAREVFDAMPERDIISWNALI
ncbi:hypothetical protein SELMODRAFT_106991, partial [Selaginella moellendorffii]